MEKYDLIIIGGSAAGASAAIYAARRKLKFSLISEDFGGEMVRSGEIWNYPGFGKTDGIALTDKFMEHLKDTDITPEIGVWVSGIEPQSDGTFLVKAKKSGADAVEYHATTVIIATGVHPRRLNILGEDTLEHKGVTWCTTCDGPLYRNKRCVTIGGGSAALESALMLAELASSITVVNKNPAFQGEQVLIDKVLADDRITVIFNAQTSEILGTDRVAGVRYTDTTSGQAHTIPADGVFVHIGVIPNTAMVPDQIETDQLGHIIVDTRCRTNLPGVYAAGDVTNIPYNQIAIAVGQGVTAALTAIEYVNTHVQS